MINAPIEVPVHLRQFAQPPKAGNGPQQKIKFVNPNSENYENNLRHSAKLHKHGIKCYRSNELIKVGEKQGPTVVVCGSGNSLKDQTTLEAVHGYVDNGALIFACKQAIQFMHKHGFHVDYGVTMDPGAHIARPEKIYKAPNMIHLVASTSDPLLFDYFMTELPYAQWLASLSEDQQKAILEKDFDAWKAGDFVLPDAGVHPAQIKIFHSATGYDQEVPLYNKLFKTSDCMGGGFNVVNRAVSAALFMGASKIVLAGCDCGWRKEDKFYVDGSENRPGVDMEDHGIVEMTDSDGNQLASPPPGARVWMTRPDMLASGVALAKLAKRNPETFVVLGDTLPAKLIEKSEDFLNKCANFQ